MRAVCRLFHDWPKWSDPQRGNKLWDGKRIGDFWFQSRTCRRCGKFAVREVASGI